MIKGFVAGILIAIAFFAGYLAFHLGVFDDVTVGEEIRGPYHVIYKDHKGAYFAIADVISDVEEHAKELGLDCDKTFGQYLDDPNEVDEDRLRSRGGCLSDKPFEKLPEDTKTGEIPQQHYAVAHFSGSPAIGPWKVYPKLYKHISDRREVITTPGSIEIYTLKNDILTTEYLIPIK